VLELALNNTRVTMRFRYAPPDNAYISSSNFLFRLIHICHPLAKIELSVLLRGDAFDLKERGIRPGVTLPPLVPKNAALCVKTSGGH